MRRWPLAYVPWMLRDLAMGPGALMLVVAVLITVAVRQATGGMVADPSGLLAGILQQVAWPFVLLATGSMVSTDLTHGYYRTLFAKPVTPAAYYLQRWLLGGAMLLAFVPVMSLGIALLARTYPLDWSLFARLALLYLLLGGLVFLFSTLTRRDWLPALLVFVVQSALASLASQVPFSPLWKALLAVLPPFDAIQFTGAMPEAARLAHVLLYGGGLIGAAVAVLLFRPVGSGGRA